MDIETADLLDLFDAKIASANAEIDSRLNAGESLDFLYASYTNELYHLEETGADINLIQKMYAKRICAGFRLANQRMVDCNWDRNEKDRFIRPFAE